MHYIHFSSATTHNDLQFGSPRSFWFVLALRLLSARCHPYALVTSADCCTFRARHALERGRAYERFSYPEIIIEVFHENNIYKNNILQTLSYRDFCRFRARHVLGRGDYSYFSQDRRIRYTSVLWKIWVVTQLQKAMIDIRRQLCWFMNYIKR